MGLKQAHKPGGKGGFWPELNLTFSTILTVSHRYSRSSSLPTIGDLPGFLSVLDIPHILNIPGFIPVYHCSHPFSSHPRGFTGVSDINLRNKPGITGNIREKQVRNRA